MANTGTPGSGVRGCVPAAAVERQVLLQRSGNEAERYGRGSGRLLRTHARPRVHHSRHLQ